MPTHQLDQSDAVGVGRCFHVGRIDGLPRLGDRHKGTRLPMLKGQFDKYAGFLSTVEFFLEIFNA